MSQNTFGNVNNPQRNFDMMTLEIIGLLRKAFQQNSEVKEVLYEGDIFEKYLKFKKKDILFNEISQQDYQKLQISMQNLHRTSSNS